MSGLRPEWIDKLKWDAQGLLPAIVQDASTREVLTLAYVNEESLLRTLSTGETWFWSRSRQELWHKGATSGNTQRVVRIAYDCDADTLLLEVDPAGPACHTGEVSCFFATVSGESPSTSSGAPIEAAAMPPLVMDVLESLESLIASRYADRPEGAYTTYLFEKGLDKILKKVGEESTEVILAAKDIEKVDGAASREAFRGEAADLVYHLLVLFRQLNFSLDDLAGELADRFGQSHSWQTARNK